MLNLLSSQEIKTVDSHLEQRGEKIYSVTNSETYVKLIFQRDIDIPNIEKIKELEKQYFALEYKKMPKFTAPIILILFGLIFFIACILVGYFAGSLIFLVLNAVLIYWFVKLYQKRKIILESYRENERITNDILQKVEQI